MKDNCSAHITNLDFLQDLATNLVPDILSETHQCTVQIDPDMTTEKVTDDAINNV